jgi:hypothetical protein
MKYAPSVTREANCAALGRHLPVPDRSERLAEFGLNSTRAKRINSTLCKLHVPACNAGSVTNTGISTGANMLGEASAAGKGVRRTPVQLVDGLWNQPDDNAKGRHRRWKSKTGTAEGAELFELLEGLEGLHSQLVSSESHKILQLCYTFSDRPITISQLTKAECEQVTFYDYFNMPMGLSCVVNCCRTSAGKYGCVFYYYTPGNSERLILFVLAHRIVLLSCFDVT